MTLNEGRAVNRQYSCCFSVIMAVAGLLVLQVHERPVICDIYEL